ncbi:DUF397 domain-containing protein [Streptomyces sp. NPDC057638]|uniref:DUF397 domain-containing protein n=1 Tax=Streptomyces sp. NPDC057638 TaxID=3346190 RepID=UPI00367B6899
MSQGNPAPMPLQWRKSSYSGPDGGQCVEWSLAPGPGFAARESGAPRPVQWRKSSYSGNNGGECVEWSPIPGLTAVRDSDEPLSAQWQKSSYSNGNGNCVEVAERDHAVAVRDSKAGDGPVLMLSSHAWAGLIALARSADV